MFRGFCKAVAYTFVFTCLNFFNPQQSYCIDPSGTSSAPTAPAVWDEWSLNLRGAIANSNKCNWLYSQIHFELSGEIADCQTLLNDTCGFFTSIASYLSNGACQELEASCAALETLRDAYVAEYRRDCI